MTNVKAGMPCAQDGCHKHATLKGYCRPHYDKRYKSGFFEEQKEASLTATHKARTATKTSKKDSMDLITDLKDILETEVEVLKQQQKNGQLDFNAMDKVIEGIKKLSSEERLWRKDQNIDGLPMDIIETLLPQAMAILQETILEKKKKSKQLDIPNNIEEPNESDFPSTDS